MARFILDIANLEDEVKRDEVREALIDHLCGHVATLRCIDTKNTNQFHDDESKNVLSEEQIQKDIEIHTKVTRTFCDVNDNELLVGDKVIYIGSDHVEETEDCDWRGDILTVINLLEVDPNYVSFYNETKKQVGDFYAFRVLKINQ